MRTVISMVKFVFMKTLKDLGSRLVVISMAKHPRMNLEALLVFLLMVQLLRLGLPVMMVTATIVGRYRFIKISRVLGKRLALI